jgi:hypothetical protein
VRLPVPADHGLPATPRSSRAKGEAIHADYVSTHETREEAVAAIEDLIQAGLASSGDFDVREIDTAGRTVGFTDAGDPPLLTR